MSATFQPNFYTATRVKQIFTDYSDATYIYKGYGVPGVLKTEIGTQISRTTKATGEVYWADRGSNKNIWNSRGSADYT